jgi:hypothetical protein
VPAYQRSSLAGNRSQRRLQVNRRISGGLQGCVYPESPNHSGQSVDETYSTVMSQSTEKMIWSTDVPYWISHSYPVVYANLSNRVVYWRDECDIPKL